MRCSVCHRRLGVCAEHGESAAPAAPPPDAPFVEGWDVGAFLGGGGYASVFAAGSGEALKIAHAVADPRFAREAAALARVGEPAAPRLVTTGVLGGRPYLIMERLRGRTLADAM